MSFKYVIQSLAVNQFKLPKYGIETSIPSLSSRFQYHLGPCRSIFFHNFIMLKCLYIIGVLAYTCVWAFRINLHLSDILELTLNSICCDFCFREGNFIMASGKNTPWGSNFNETKNFKLIVVKFIQTFSLIKGNNLSRNIQI